MDVRTEFLPLVGSSFRPDPHIKGPAKYEPFFCTDHGALYDIDCVDFLRMIGDEQVDTVFADPPFNLKKEYGSRSNDNRSPDEYIAWCKLWIDEATRTLKPGGAFFLYNIPKWNILLGAYMSEIGLDFRHWITINIKFGLPIRGRLYPSHYSLLYFTKGKPRVFRKIRTPIETCRHCGGEIKDYGGHRHAMNPKGVNLTDVWNDIPPVRHWKYKSIDRKANALSSKLLDRVVEMSTEPGDLVIDPFGGSGTTFAVCEAKHRRWLGTDIDFAPVIRERLSGDLFLHKNDDVLDLD
ncbi:DNA-methyltransferase [Paracoccus bogoriensis]|uniref:DNA-methyltransferase n=1 Tax=Paracoccus bogoriensis TaxID=242065 RepID=UPI001CA593D1|nr:site-specific DNA-methyltransferase [Paracoccus bogoriensis]